MGKHMNIHGILRSMHFHDGSGRYIGHFKHCTLPCRGAHSQWSKAVSAAEKVVGYPTSFMNLRFWLSDEMSNVAVNMRKLIGTKHPLMKTAKGLLFDNKENMQTRGLVVLLMSKGAGHPKESRNFLHHRLDNSYSDSNPMTISNFNGSGILSTQRSLAEITEMINTAFVIHKGVMDIDLNNKPKPYDSETADLLYGNKMAILSGDYLLAKASSGLSSLGNTYVVESMASAISDLMESSFFFVDRKDQKLDLDTWEQWSYKNGACLYAKSCQSALMLSQHSASTSDQAFDFGRYFGLLRQLRTDYEGLEPHRDDSEAPSSSIYSVLSRSEIYELKKEYTCKATSCLSVLPHLEAKEALVNILSAVSDNIF
ncbi:all trans-polyprenyl-diphosphate synthase PDSS2-like [Watersipora subatra]|uniref:all trans-polyprenyl-diphosphate synthase PDSS2-like n=1 Tax=Watersipora subatra TaxID=2589382 RepID=UPI00355B3995